MRILAVDDDPVILDILSNALESSGFGNLTFATNAEDALELIKDARVPFDTFLLDIMLPGTSGIEMCREIRKLDQYRSTPIIMVTGVKAPDMMGLAFEAGATDFVTKPFDGLELGTRINLAALLNESLQRERMNSHALEELSRLTAISFDERFDVRKARGVRGFLEMENDFLRKGDSQYAMTMFGVQIDDALGIFRRTKPAQFRAIVEAVAFALADTMDIENTRFAYAGRGAMIGVAFSRESVSLKALEEAVNATLAETWVEWATGLKLPPNLSVRRVGKEGPMSGHAAANAMRSFQGRADLRDGTDPEEVNGLFARLSLKIGNN